MRPLVNSLDPQYPCRTTLQIRQLSALLDPVSLSFKFILFYFYFPQEQQFHQRLKLTASLLISQGLPSPPSIVLYGLEATGKSLITRAMLKVSCLTYSWIACNESITARHLTERIAAAVMEVEADAVAQEQENGIVKMRAENVNALSVVLRMVLGTKSGQEEEQEKKKHVLVLDRIDKQREATLILLAGLARLGEIVNILRLLLLFLPPLGRRNYRVYTNTYSV